MAAQLIRAPFTVHVLPIAVKRASDTVWEPAPTVVKPVYPSGSQVAVLVYNAPQQAKVSVTQLLASGTSSTVMVA